MTTADAWDIIFRMGKSESNAARLKRILVMVEEKQLVDVDEFQRKHRFKSRNDTLRWLLTRALASTGIDRMAKDRP